MKLNFRQGIVRARTSLGMPDFLEYNLSNNTININITTTPVIVTVAHESVNYLIREATGTSNAWPQLVWKSAWGTQPPTPTYYLYWNISLSTGEITRNYTRAAPIVSSSQPGSPTVDQHWFDTGANLMKYWDGTFWRPCIRVFAGYWSPSLVSLTHFPFGTQVSISNAEPIYPAGFLALGGDLKALRSSSGEFVTTESDVVINEGSFTSPVQLEGLNSDLIASEPIPAWSAVYMTDLGQIGLASGVDANKRAIGLAVKNCLPGDATKVISSGLASNESWAWDLNDGRELFAGLSGQLVQIDPNTDTTTASQKVGMVLSATTILVNLDTYNRNTVVGPTGPAGIDGKTTFNNQSGPGLGQWTGPGDPDPKSIPPSDSIGVDGDFYLGTILDNLNDNFGKIYLFGPKVSGSWDVGLQVTGETGATGPTGPIGMTGPTGPSVTGPTGSSSGLVNWTEGVSTTAPNAFVPAVFFTPNNVASDVDAVISSKGNGALLRQVPDNTPTGGNKRGILAVDLQGTRLNADRVASGIYAVIAGGYNNRASADLATVSGGEENFADGIHSTIAGGVVNEVQGDRAVVSGGTQNSAAGATSVIAGGRENTAEGEFSAIGGGSNNFTDTAHKHSTIPGGMSARSRSTGSFNFSSGGSGNPGDSQLGEYTLTCRVNDDTPTKLFPILGDETHFLEIPQYGYYVFDGLVIAAADWGGSNSFGAWRVEGVVRCAGDSSTVELLSQTVTVIENGDALGLGISVEDQDPVAALVLTFTGTTENSYTVTARIRTAEVIGQVLA